MSKPTKPVAPTAKSEPIFETFYRISRKGTYEYSLESVQVDVSENQPKVIGDNDIRSIIVNRLKEKFE